MKTVAVVLIGALIASCGTVVALADSCSINPYPQAVYTNQLLPFSIAPPEYQSCGNNGADVIVTIVAAPTEGTLMTAGGSLLYQAPSYETDDVADIVLTCPSTGASCDLLVGFLVSAPITVAPTTTTVVSGTGTPTATTTPAPTLPQCPNTSMDLQVQLNSVLNTALPARLTSVCPTVTTYRGDATNAKGRLYVNLIGSVLIVGSQFETLETFNIIASCDAVPVCNIPITVANYAALTSPTAPTTAPPPTACPNIYYYEAPIGAVYSSSLRDMPGQPMCTFGMAFTLIDGPSAGALNMALNGDFTYSPPTSEGWTEFNFNLNCMGVVSCVGTARMLVTKAVGVIPVSTTASTTAPQIPFVSDGYTTCAGTCNENAWKTLPGTSLVWDSDVKAVGNVALPRQDGRAIGAIGVDYVNGSLKIFGYSQIGSLAARFLTFEPVTDFNSGSGNSLASFKSQCLANQPQIGFSEEVWRWSSLANKTGYVGVRYNSGTSYYHKFGGKHIGCDTFAANSCRYAPLLTPNINNWKVDVSSCDVTWTGTFNVSNLLTMRNSKSETIFYHTSSKDVEGVVYSQAVTARSWLEPSLGVISNTVAHQLSLTFDTAVAIAKADAATPFTVDAEYFEYTDANGDKAFGINIAFFSLTSASGRSFTPDRHVKGFRFLKTDWRAPNRDSCPTCSGTATVCTVASSASDSAFVGNFSQGTCANGVGIVSLKKGPMMTDSDCVGYATTNQVKNRIGFSPTRACSNSFQNLTIRGTAVGSRKTTTPLSFEGAVTLQLLLDSGARPIVTIDISSYVSRVAIDQGFAGNLAVCRASPYWPIYDPLGTSLPDSPHRLAVSKHSEHSLSSEDRFMCLDQNDMRFGPTGWAVFSLDAPGLDPKGITVDSIFIQLPNSQTPIYLLYRDPSTGAFGEPPAALGAFWKRTHPFLNFRFIKDASKMSRSSHVTLSPSTTFGFAFTPGAFNIDSTMLVTAVVRSTTLKADGTFTTGAATFRRTIFTDPLLSATTRYGIATVGDATASEHSATWSFELGVAAAATIGIIFLGIIVISADENRKLPPWMPRATIINDIPILGEVVGKKKASAVDKNGNPKLAVYSNPYEAAIGPRFQS